MTLAYRKDIDGLRAIAVLSVILFHAGFGEFSGGFVGVDIFFVISGYLISGIIYRELSHGNFSLKDFYRRRFRRIVPALFVVTIFSLIIGVFLLPPNLLKDLGKSAEYTAFFASNIYFYHHSGYFDVASTLKPLLHTWSLAVEEQYYLFFPFMMLWLFIPDRLTRLRKGILLLLALSLILSIFITPVNRTFAFYLLPTRIWEFFIGVVSAVGIVPVLRHRTTRELWALLGAVLIVVSVIFYTDRLNFPGFWALLPALGTALILHTSTASDYTLISRVLSWKPLVGIGTISYSLYLWHWPILVYGKLYYLQEIPFITLILLLAMAFLLAWASWRFIEVPFRREVTPIQRRWGTFRVSFAMLGIILAFGLFYKVTDGLGNRYHMDIAFANQSHQGDCEEQFRRTGIPCRLGNPNNPPQFLLWGDSHARALIDGVNQAAKDLNQSGVVTTLSSCPPLLGVDRKGRRFCEEFNLKVLSYLQAHPELNTVILAARWPLSWYGTRFGKEEGHSIKLVNVQNPSRGINNSQLFKKGLEDTLSQLHDMNRSVILVMPIPEVGINVPSMQPAITLRGLSPAEYAPKSTLYIQRSGPIRKWFLSLSLHHPDLKIVDPAQKLAKKYHLKLFHKGITLYRDNNHLSAYGSLYLTPLFTKALKRTLRKR